jgi:hypothetical protein
MGLMALPPLRRKLCYGFLLPLKIHHPWLDLNPRTLGPTASMLTTRPLRATTYSFNDALSIVMYSSVIKNDIKLDITYSKAQYQQ